MDGAEESSAACFCPLLAAAKRSETGFQERGEVTQAK
jgi:hypothetical protein